MPHAGFQGGPVVSLLAPLRGFPFWGQVLEPLYKVIMQPAWARPACDNVPSILLSALAWGSELGLIPGLRITG